MSGQALSRTSPGFSIGLPVIITGVGKHYRKLACIYFKEYLPYVKKYVFLEVSYELLSGAINEKDSTDYRGKCRVWRGMCP